MSNYFINGVAQTVHSDWVPILMTEEQRFNFWQGQKCNLFSLFPDRLWALISEALSLTVKQQKREADHLI
jgi:hypothetical protein